jgi:hypothetical protein
MIDRENRRGADAVPISASRLPAAARNRQRIFCVKLIDLINE